MDHRPIAAARTAQHAVLLLAPLAAATLPTATVAQEIVLDGAFDDWQAVAVATTDPRDDAPPGAELDLGDVRVAHDAGFLHVLVELVPADGPDARPLRNLQKLRGDLVLVLDADGDASSGRTAHGLEGADVEVQMTTGDRRQGFAVRTAGAGGRGLSPDVLGVAVAPTYAAPEAELRLERGRRLPGGAPLLTGDRVRGKLVHRDARGNVLDETDVFDHALATPFRADELAGVAAIPARPADALRAVSWNIERGNLRTRAAVVGRIVRALDADVLMLQELTEDMTEDEVTSILSTATGDEWAAQVGTRGGNLRTAVAVRNRPGRQADRLAALEPMPGEGRGVRSAALAVRHQERWIAFVSVHLKCCGSIGDRSDRTRIEEVNAIRRGVARGLGSRWTEAALPIRGLVVAGDYNLVGSRDPLDLLVRGGDRDGSDLAIVDAPQLDGRSNLTWDKPGQAFPPGRLDFVTIGDLDLEPRQAFVLDARDLAPAALRASGLEEGDTEDASDHLPVVVDLAWRTAR